MSVNWGWHMTDKSLLAGVAAVIKIDNLDTDQIMPKQFLRGLDKSGLDKGLLWDLRYDELGQPRSNFILNQAEYSKVTVLIAGANFGCGSSREHAVWGLQQFGIHAVIAPSFGEIFYSNCMNNGLLSVMLPQAQLDALMAEALQQTGPMTVEIDLKEMVVRSPDLTSTFKLSDRHRTMFLDGTDMIESTLTHETDIAVFSESHWSNYPWLRDIASRTKERIDTL